MFLVHRDHYKLPLFSLATLTTAEIKYFYRRARDRVSISTLLRRGVSLKISCTIKRAFSSLDETLIPKLPFGRHYRISTSTIYIATNEWFYYYSLFSPPNNGNNSPGKDLIGPENFLIFFRVRSRVINIMRKRPRIVVPGVKIRESTSRRVQNGALSKERKRERARSILALFALV